MSTPSAQAMAGELLSRKVEVSEHFRLAQLCGLYSNMLLATAAADPKRFQKGVEMIFNAIGVAISTLRLQGAPIETRTKHAERLGKRLMEVVLEEKVG